MKKLGGVSISPRTGRPKSDNPRKYRAEARLNEYEYKLLKDVVKKTQKSASEILVSGIYEEARACGMIVRAITRENGSK